MEITHNQPKKFDPRESEVHVGGFPLGRVWREKVWFTGEGVSPVRKIRWFAQRTGSSEILGKELSNPAKGFMSEEDAKEILLADCALKK